MARVTTLPPARLKASTERTLPKSESLIAALPAMESVSLPLPPSIVFRERALMSVKRKVSPADDPFREILEVLPAVTLRSNAPEEATTDVMPDLVAFLSRVTVELPPRERTSTPVVFAKAASPMVAAWDTARVSVPAPAMIVSAVSCAVVATVNESFNAEPTILKLKVSAAVWVIDPAMTVEKPAFPPRVTAEDPVRERTSTPETLAKEASLSVALEATTSVSRPAPPERESAATWALVASENRSLPSPPARVSPPENESPWVRVLFPVPAMTLLIPAARAALLSTTEEAPVRERTSVPLMREKLESTSFAALAMRRVSDPEPPAIEEAMN